MERGGRGGGRGGHFRGGNRFRGNGATFYEDRRGSKRPFNGRGDYDRGDSKHFREDREELHPDLVGLKNFLSQMKAHWKTQKMEKDEEDIMVSNVLKQTVGKESLLAKSEAYHLNCNVADFLTRNREPAVLARFMRAFNIEKTPPQHKTIKIFEALVDSSLDYFRSPDQFVSGSESDEEDDNNDESIDYKSIFSTWLHCLGLFVVDNIECYFYEETMFTQRILCVLCGKKFLKDLHGGVDTETTFISEQLIAVRDRYFTYLTKEADLDALMCHHQARFVVSLSVRLAASLELKKVIKRFVKHVFSRDDVESILTNTDSFIVLDSILRHAGKFGLASNCTSKILELADQISQSNPGIVSGMFDGLEDKDEFVELYDKLADKWTLELLTKNASVAGACARFDMKQNDYLEKLFVAMTAKEGGSEQNFVFLIRNLGLGPTFKVVCGFKAQQKVLKALDELSEQELFNLACSSHVHLLEAVVASGTIGEKVKIKILSKLFDKAEQLAVDKFGSRLLDAVMINCQVKTIKLIATELIKHKKTLLGDRIGKFIFLHWGLKYFEDNNKEAWNNVISNSKDRKRQKLLSVLSG